MNDYAGCIHFHSSYSYDASIPPAQIVQAGLDAGVDYLILSDHFRMDARDEGWERYHESGSKKLLMIVGEEISPRYNHYLALDIKKPIVVSKVELDAQGVIDAVTAQGGFGFIVHPDHSGAPFVGVRAYPWVDWNAKGYAGMGIWDLMGDWTSALTSPWGVFRAWVSPSSVLRGPKPETLFRWDALTQRDHCVAIGEVDNHGTHKRWGLLSKTIFPFDYAFRTIRTHVLLEKSLTGSLESDRQALLHALRQGQSYVSLDLWNDPRGFSFEVYDDARRTGSGGQFTRQGPALIEAKVPVPGRLRLIRNGRVIREESPRSHLERDVDLPGVYRVQIDQRVRGRWRPWIYSNPIWVS